MLQVHTSHAWTHKHNCNSQQVPGIDYLLGGYVQGKRQAEEELARTYPDGARGVI